MHPTNTFSNKRTPKKLLENIDRIRAKTSRYCAKIFGFSMESAGQETDFAALKQH